MVSFLNQDCDIFSGDFEKLKQLTQGFPYLTRLISELLSFHSTKFLPTYLTAFMFSLLNLREEFDIKAEQRAVKRTKPKNSFESCPAEIYPNLPEHTIENEYVADLERDKTEDISCSKAYNSKVDIKGGLTRTSAQRRERTPVSFHFSLLNPSAFFSIFFQAVWVSFQSSSQQVLAPVVRRLPRRVQAQHCYFVYDNCCASHKGALLRTHYKNHTACHAGYNIDEFPQLKNINSQQAEQINRSLRSLATVVTVLAHYKWETYLKVLELFFVRRNMRMKKQ